MVSSAGTVIFAGGPHQAHDRSGSANFLQFLAPVRRALSAERAHEGAVAILFSARSVERALPVLGKPPV
jgi:hypothetical protein